MESNKASASTSFSNADKSDESEPNRKQSKMRKVLGGLTRSVSNYYGGNCEESENYFVMAIEMTDEDFEQEPYLLPLQNVLEECNFMYDIRPNKNVKERLYFLQDKYMRLFFDFYPDFICVDVLCELPKLKLNMYLFTGIDTNGSCEILALGFIKSGDAGLKWLCDTFIKHNQKSVEKVKIILPSKILQDNQVFLNAFSGKPILTSFFHFMQSLKKDISYFGFNANDQNTEKVMIIFEKLSAASSKTECFNLFKELERKYEDLSKKREIMVEIKEHLILSRKFDFKLIYRSFNVFLYSVRKSLRPIICSFDTIEEVLKFYSTFLENNRREKFKNLLSTFEKPVVNAELVDYLKYSQILTPFATKLVFEQIDNSCRMTIPSPDDVVDQNFDFSQDFCNCNFFLLLSLPCIHILDLRRRHRLPLFDEELCSKKWFKANYKNELSELFNVFFEQSIHTNFQECKNYFGISAWPLECPGNISEQRFIILQHLMRFWDQELNINILVPPSGSLSSDNHYLLESNSSCSSLTGKKTIEELYGISLKNVLNCDDYTT